MNIYITDPIHNYPLSLAKENGNVVKWDDPKIDNWSEAEALIVRTTKIGKQEMLNAPKLKIIAKHGIGTDNIDLEAAKELGILVTNTPRANIESVAELIVALILACGRKIPKASQMTKEGLDKLAPRELTGIELNGKTIGLIGLGSIGLSVSNILKNGFNMNILGYDPYLSYEDCKSKGINKIDSLEEMLSISDIVSISIPLLESTLNLIGEKELSAMKKSAILINTSRGKIVNELALYKALKNNEIAGAALDVFAIEPPEKQNPLFSLDNFIGTPHIGAATEEALIRMGESAVYEIIRVKSNIKPKYLVK